MNMMIEVKGSDTLPQTETVTPSVPQSTAPTLASSAMLVEVNISNWVGRKKDKRASADVTTQNHADTGVASVNKKLLANSDTLKAIQTHVTAVRAMHANMTMPWSELWPASATHRAVLQVPAKLCPTSQNEFHRLVQLLPRQLLRLR